MGRQIRKWLTLGLILALLAALTAALGEEALTETASSGTDPEKLTPQAGWWTIKDISREDTMIPRESLLKQGVLIEMEIREDGTGTLFLAPYGEDTEFTVDAGAHVLRVPGQERPFWFEGETLCVRTDGFTYAFDRVDVRTEVPEAEDAPDAAKAIGFWRMEQRTNMETGVTRDRAALDAIGYDASLEITEDGIFVFRDYSDGCLLQEERHTYEPRVAGRYVILVLDGDFPQVLDIQGDHLIITLDRKTTAVFVRSTPDQVHVLSPEEVGTQDAEQLIGLWRIREFKSTDGMVIDRGMMDRVGFDETMEFTADGICVMTIYDHGEAMEESRDTYEGRAPGVLLVNDRYLEHYSVEDDVLTITEPDNVLVFTRVPQEEAAEE